MSAGPVQEQPANFLQTKLAGPVLEGYASHLAEKFAGPVQEGEAALFPGRAAGPVQEGLAEFGAAGGGSVGVQRPRRRERNRRFVSFTPLKDQNL